MYKIIVDKVEYVRNVDDEEIVDFIERYLLVEGGKIKIYRKRTWGSCRLWKVVTWSEDNKLLIEQLNGNIKWIDKSSKKNPDKTALVDIDKLVNKRIKVYIAEVPSCNKSKMKKIIAWIRIVREEPEPAREQLN